MSLSLSPRHLASRLRPRSRRQYIATGIAVVLVLGGAGYWGFGRADSAVANSVIATVATGTFQQTVTGSGTIQPARQDDLAFGVSGRVTSVRVEAGDKVGKGDVVAKLDTVSLDAALASAEAQLEAAVTTAANDGSESSTQRAANDASLASTRADVAQAEDDLASATLRATFAGTVASVDVAVGDQTSGSSSSTSGSGGSAQGAATTTSTAAVTVIDPTTFVVEAEVAAADVTSVKKGLQVTITPTGATEPVFGTVEDVGLIATTNNSGVAAFSVTVAVTGEQKDLYPGTTADISIIVKQVDDIVTVPTQALTTTDGKTYVTKVDGSSRKKTAVTVGETYGASTEVKTGLVVGDQVEITSIAVNRVGNTAGGGGAGTGQRGQGGGDFPAGGRPGGAGQ
ncbi:secretion protein HlyD [Aeromicrobium sp. A1-2]|uniref:efflux RND transporter periplasmic adaptor subunit n=1 Tax=Aeromicrobium sp. A1-2 TaxID=2107713 RepID=UPI000E471216|nr:biotin/lipoyl-binding protein [Aeromicrobium sp. A1-2]AXT83822.1 secretion protein HlyD [Aeromicrobium sp. A1-2]